MKKYLLSLASLGVVLFLSGCILSENSFPEKYIETPFEDHPLLGRWSENASPDDALAKNLNITLENGKLVAVQTPRDKTKPSTSTFVYDVVVYRHNNMDFAAIKQRSDDSRYWMLFKYAIENDSLMLWSLSDSALNKALETRRLSARLEDKTSIVTSPSEEILKVYTEAPDADFNLDVQYNKTSEE